MCGAVFSKQGTNIPKRIIVFNGTAKKKYIGTTLINTCVYKKKQPFLFLLSIESKCKHSGDNISHLQNHLIEGQLSFTPIRFSDRGKRWGFFLSISIKHSSPQNKHCLFQWDGCRKIFVRTKGVLPLSFFALFKCLCMWFLEVYMSKMFSQCAFCQCLMQHISSNLTCRPSRNHSFLRYVTVTSIAVCFACSKIILNRHSFDILIHLKINKKYYKYLVFNHLEGTKLRYHPAKTSK